MRESAKTILGLPSGEAIRRYLCWLFVAFGLVAVAVGLVALFPASQRELGREGGILERLSLSCWFGTVVVGVWTFFTSRRAPDRLAASWTGLVALLAFMRELDLHVVLNPQALGRFGVRYRIDWWLDGSVSLWLKLGWLVVFFALMLALIYPPWALRRSILRRLREGDAMLGLFVLAMAMSALGFVFDDLVRKVTFVSLQIRQVAEESAEVLGAAAFLASAMLRCPRCALSVARLAEKAQTLIGRRRSTRVSSPGS